jgi:acyl dehydratase
MRYLEDFHVGEVIDLGSVALTEEEMLEFGRRFDPQPFHVDPEAARETVFGGLIASGWHTGSLYMRLFSLAVLNQSASMASPGLEELRWLKPVRPGDVLRGTYEVLEVTPSESNPSRGTVRARGELVNQDGEVVLRLVARNHFGRTPSPQGGQGVVYAKRSGAE